MNLVIEIIWRNMIDFHVPKRVFHEKNAIGEGGQYQVPIMVLF